MDKESNKRNGLAHVPTCSTWQPAWLASPADPHSDELITPSIIADDPEATNRLAALRAYVDGLSRDAAWRGGWKLLTGNPDAWQSAIRVGGFILDDFGEAIKRGDISSLDSRENWLQRVVHGEQYRQKKSIASFTLRT